MEEKRRFRIGDKFALIELVEKEGKRAKTVSFELFRKDNPSLRIEVNTFTSPSDSVDVRSYIPLKDIIGALKENKFDIVEALFSDPYNSRKVFFFISILDAILRLSDENEISEYAKRIKTHPKSQRFIEIIKRKLRYFSHFDYDNRLPSSITHEINIEILASLITSDDEYVRYIPPHDSIKLYPILFELPIERIYLTSTDLIYFPPNFHHTKAEKMEISGEAYKDVRCIFPDNFHKAKSIKSLSIKYVKDVIFPKKLPDSLESLHIKDSKISFLFINSKSLRKITFEKVTIDPNISVLDVIGDCPNLEEIVVKGCIVHRIPIRFSRFKNLRKINIITCNCKHFEDSIPSIPSLKEFTAADSLGYIPHTISNLQSLETLEIYNLPYVSVSYMSENPIIPFTIENLKHLKNLKLSNFNLRNISPIFSLRSLETLSLLLNPISNLPDSFDRFPNLKSIDLSYTDIDHLPPSIYSCNNIEEMILRGLDNLKGIQRNILKLPKLRLIDITSTMLKYIPQELFFKRGIKILSTTLPRFINTNCGKLDPTEYAHIMDTLGNLVYANIMCNRSFSISVIDLNRLPFGGIGADKIPRGIDVKIHINAYPNEFAKKALAELLSRATSVELIIKLQSHILIKKITEFMKDLYKLSISIYYPIDFSSFPPIRKVKFGSLSIFYPVQTNHVTVDLSPITSVNKVSIKLGSRYTLITPQSFSSLNIIRFSDSSNISEENIIYTHVPPEDARIEFEYKVGRYYYNAMRNVKILPI